MSSNSNGTWKYIFDVTEGGGDRCVHDKYFYLPILYCKYNSISYPRFTLELWSLTFSISMIKASLKNSAQGWTPFSQLVNLLTNLLALIFRTRNHFYWIDVIILIHPSNQPHNHACIALVICDRTSSTSSQGQACQGFRY